MLHDSHACTMIDDGNKLLRNRYVASPTHLACSGVPETMIITDINYYPVAPYHFDLSGTTFGAMAKEDRNDVLQHARIIDIRFKRYVAFFDF
jgi:hypothetical protein